MSVKLLDCTLRDGGHINHSLFGKRVINGVIQKLSASNMDYIEVGFLRTDMDTTSSDLAIFSSIAEAEKKIPQISGNSELVLLAQEDQFDIQKLEPCNDRSRFKMIRVSFHDCEIGLKFCEQIILKGYKCCINPINLTGYSDEQILTIVREANRIKPFALTIVDTFGSMRFQDLGRIYYLIENNLNENIAIGLHLHENLSLSFSLGQNFLNIKNPCRDVIIDGSLYGMGRVPGNLCIELMMDYMNLNYNTNYVTPEALEAIDEFIIPIRQKTPWGYSIAYSLSANCKVHRTYAEYLLQKGKITIADINFILQKISSDNKGRYNENYIESLYREYMDVWVDDDQVIKELRNKYENKNICMIAPGKSIKNNLSALLNSANPDYIFCLNFVDERIALDGVFYTNQKRYNNDYLNIDYNTVVLSSNIRNSHDQKYSIVSYARLTEHFEIYSESSILMALNLFTLLNCRRIMLIGFDGFTMGENFYSKGYERVENYEDNIPILKELLPKYAEQIDISFLTPSKYEVYL